MNTFPPKFKLINNNKERKRREMFVHVVLHRGLLVMSTDLISWRGRDVIRIGSRYKTG